MEYMYKAQIVKYKQCLNAESDHLIKAIAQHDTSRGKYSIAMGAQEIERELHIPQGNALKMRKSGNL